jgi:hypothetical protein
MTTRVAWIIDPALMTKTWEVTTDASALNEREGKDTQ